MSLLIDIEAITSVFIDGLWFPVEKGSFFLDSYEFGSYYDNGGKSGFDVFHRGGNSGVCATGFCFRVKDKDETMEGPLTAIKAVRRERRRHK